MSLEFFVKDRAVPELFERLIGDVEQLAGDLERLQRFVELCGGAAAPAAPPDPAAPAAPPDPAAPPAAPEPMELLSSPPGGRSRAEMEAVAKEMAQTMVNRIAYAAEQGWSPVSGLTYAIRVMRDASQGFQCPQTMAAILTALADMEHHQLQANTEEGQANG